MSRSTSTSYGDVDVDGIERDGLPVSRYDLVLAVVPVAFLAGLLLAELAGVSIRVALAAGAAVGALALVDGLFLNPPGRPPSARRGRGEFSQ